MVFKHNEVVKVRVGVGLKNEGCEGIIKNKFGYSTYLVDLIGKGEVLYTAAELCHLFEDDPKTPLEETERPSSRNYQVGGDHYSGQGIQPIDYIMANELDFCEGNVVKYVTRWKFKNGVEDLKKARQYLDFLIEGNEDV
jgi:hypothetical protein